MSTGKLFTLVIVISAILLGTVTAAAQPADPLYALQWDLEAVGFEALSSSSLDGSGVVVAVIDSGLDPSHEDLKDIKISPLSRNLLGDGSHPEAWRRDQNGHGSMVAGRIACASGNGVGLASIAPGAEIMVLRCASEERSAAFPYDPAFDSGGGSLEAVSSAIIYAADNGADVINISMGSSEAHFAGISGAIDHALEKGCIVVASVGNSQKDSRALYYPAACEGVIGVGAVDKELKTAPFSQQNGSVDIAAPGSGVTGVTLYPEGFRLPASGGDHYGEDDGTSFSAPLVSALAAICRQAVPGLDCEGFLSLLAVSSADLGPAGKDESTGWGLISCEGMLKALGAAYAAGFDSRGGSPAEDIDYKLGQKDVPLPAAPERAGYIFTGWYEDPSLTGSPAEAVDTVKPGPPERDLEGGGCRIGKKMYYAGWKVDGSASLSSLRVRGTEASFEKGVFTAVLPQGALSGRPLRAADVAARSDIAGAEISVTVTGASSAEIAVSAGPSARTYALRVIEAENPAPALAPGVSAVRGSAVLGSLDGAKAAEPFALDLSSCFSGAAGYEIAECTGSGALSVRDGALSYVPGGTDRPGSSVRLRAVAKDPSLPAYSAFLDIEIAVSRAESRSEVFPREIVYDTYKGDEPEVSVRLYDNSLKDIMLDGISVPGNNYIYSSAGRGDGTVELELLKSWLRQIPVGEHELSFRFSAGDPATVKFTVVDGSPVCRVRFFIEKGSPYVYTTMEGLKKGLPIGRLPVPSELGGSFAGWIRDDSGSPVSVDQHTPVNRDMDLYAVWYGEAPKAWYIPFEDVEKDAPYRKAVVWAFNAAPRVSDGLSETVFGPDKGCTRAQALTMLWRACGCPEPDEAAGDFSDVGESDWFYKPVKWAIQLGVSEGTSKERFSPHAPCTNAQMLTFVWRALGRPGSRPPEGEEAWWAQALEWARGKRLAGVSDEAAPGSPCSRKDAVRLLYSCFAE